MPEFFFILRRKGRRRKRRNSPCSQEICENDFILFGTLTVKVSNLCRLFLYYSCALYRSFSEVIHTENIPYISETAKECVGKCSMNEGTSACQITNM